VLAAIDILVRGSQDTESVLARMDPAWFQSPREFVTLLVALDEMTSARSSELRGLLVKRFAEERGLDGREPPERALARVPIEGGELLVDGRRVRIAPFFLQRHEVTNDEYRRFDPTHDAGAPGDHPVTNVTWYEAMAYAAWLGGSLPTEAEWELAARGKNGRIYPWGNAEPTPARANFNWGAREPAPAPVGSHPEGATPEGIHDLAGNVWEWCRDGASANLRILKGGSFFNDERFLTAAPKNFHHPDEGESVVGFRVAWPEERRARSAPDAR
jgi:formylglycine-generating enzyme required for sulfatase activity